MNIFSVCMFRLSGEIVLPSIGGPINYMLYISIKCRTPCVSLKQLKLVFYNRKYQLDE